MWWCRAFEYVHTVLQAAHACDIPHRSTHEQNTSGELHYLHGGANLLQTHFLRFLHVDCDSCNSMQGHSMPLDVVFATDVSDMQQCMVVADSQDLTHRYESLGGRCMCRHLMSSRHVSRIIGQKARFTNLTCDWP